MFCITVAIFSCEASDQALNVQWIMNGLFPEDSLTSFGIWPESHTVSIMKRKLWACEDVCASYCVCSCIFVYICMCVCVCECMYKRLHTVLGQAGLYASNICRGLVRVLHGEVAEDT